MVLVFVYARNVVGYLKVFMQMEQEQDFIFMMISQPMDYLELYVQNVIVMSSYEFVAIIKNLIAENKELRERIDVTDEILHSYLPIIERKEDESKSERVLRSPPPKRVNRYMLRMQKLFNFLYRILGRRR